MHSSKSEQDLKIEEVLIKKKQLDNQLKAVTKDKHLLVLDMMINQSHHLSKNPYKINNLKDYLVLLKMNLVLELRICLYKSIKPHCKQRKNHAFNLKKIKN